MMLNDKFSENTSSVMCFPGGGGVPITLRPVLKLSLVLFPPCPIEVKDSHLYLKFHLTQWIR